MKFYFYCYWIVAFIFLINGCKTKPHNLSENSKELSKSILPAEKPKFINLHQAAKKGDVEQVKYLIENGTDVDTNDILERTGLHYAAREGHKDIVELLITNNAHVNAKDIDCLTPLHYATLQGHRDITEYLLTNGAFINEKDIDEYTPLNCAICCEHQDIALLLINSGADIQTKVDYGISPLLKRLKQDYMTLSNYF